MSAQNILPTTHHVISCVEFGAPDVMRWEEQPLALLQSDEVLIKVAAAGINRADTLQRQGKYPPPAGASPILGLEVSGTIIALGVNVTRWRAGDAACALLEGGGYADYVIARVTQCLPIPHNVSLRDAAALPEACVTVWANLFVQGKLQAGESVLIHGGSSGIGTMAIQMAKAFGVTVYATVSTEEKAQACRALGADGVINYRTHDFGTEILRLTNGRGVDMVLDMVGGDYLGRNLALLAPAGRHISIATQQGRRAEIDLREVMHKRLTVTGSTLRGRDKAEKAALIQEVEAKIWPLIAKNIIKPMVFQVFPIKNTAEAHKMMESGAHIGKILLEVAG